MAADGLMLTRRPPGGGRQLAAINVSPRHQLRARRRYGSGQDRAGHRLLGHPPFASYCASLRAPILPSQGGAVRGLQRYCIRLHMKANAKTRAISRCHPLFALSFALTPLITRALVRPDLPL